IIGAVGFLWLGFWFMFYEKPTNQRRLSAAELAYIQSDEQVNEVPAGQEETQAERVSWIRLLGYRQTWAFALGKFLTDGIWWFFLFWLPAYLTSQYGMEGTAIMLPLVVLYSMTMFGSIGGGWFPMYFIRKGYSPYDGRMR